MSTLASLSRRDLLKSGGALVVSFVFAPVFSRVEAQTNAPAALGSRPLDRQLVDSFFSIGADGSVTLYTSKVDIGTGIRIAMAQMAAEELGIRPERITVVCGDTGVCPDQGGTGGSSGLRQGGTEIRQAAATARRALIELGAVQLGRPAGELTIIDGRVRPIAGGEGLPIESLVSGRRFDLKVDPKAPLVDPARYAVVGKPLPRPDVPTKCTGKHTYVTDVTVPGMLHARVIRPTAVGATLVSVDESLLRGIPDVRAVRIQNFLAVVAKDEWAAIRAAQALKPLWTDAATLPGSDAMARAVRQGTPVRDETLVSRGDSLAALPSAVTKVSASFYWPLQSHASLGPSCAVADVRADGTTTVWSATQGVTALRTTLAKIFGLPLEKMRVVFVDGSGSYGVNGGDSAAADAVLLSKTVGAPVRVQWMRGDELGWDPKGPAQLIDVQAGLDAQGRIVSWDTQMWLPAQTPGDRPFLGVDAAGLTQDLAINAGAITRNGDPPYEATNVRVLAHWIKESPLWLSNLRAPGRIGNVLAVEAVTDQLAAATGVDPVEFRLSRLTDPRALEVIKRTAARFRWQTRTSPNPAARQGDLLVGRGLAYMRYNHTENYVATAMEIEVDPSTGRVGVRRVVCAHDGGLVVNHDGLRNQVEGSIVQTLSRVLYEEVTFDRSRVTSIDWVSYPVLRFPEAPTVDVELVDHPELPICGGGEAATVPVAGALANAFHDATGVWLRTVPFTRARVKAALADAE